MTDIQVIQKYGISDEDLLYIQAMYNGTILHSDNKDIETFSGVRPGPVAHIESFSDKSYNRAMTLFLILTNEELSVIV